MHIYIKICITEDYMLEFISSYRQLNTAQLMEVYFEGNLIHGERIYPYLDTNKQRYRAEDDFLSYLQEDFFRQKGAKYAVWNVDGHYKAALRLEPYKDGLLLEALETAPASRRKRYAYNLMTSVLDHLQTVDCRFLYSHIHKRNIASLNLHIKCGFRIIADYASYIDGTITHNSCTLRYDF